MEFNIPLEEVLSWPLKKTLEYSIFLKKWYKKKYGDPEDMDDFDFTSGMDKSIPKVSKRRLKSKFMGKSSRRGAKGHKYKFK